MQRHLKEKRSVQFRIFVTARGGGGWIANYRRLEVEVTDEQMNEQTDGQGVSRSKIYVKKQHARKLFKAKDRQKSPTAFKLADSFVFLSFLAVTATTAKKRKTDKRIGLLKRCCPPAFSASNVPPAHLHLPLHLS